MSYFGLTESPIENVQLNVDPLITDLVVGTPSRSDYPTQRLLRPIQVPTWRFDYQTYGVEHLQAHDTERAMRAEIRHADWEGATVTDKLRRFSFAVLKDEDEIANAHPSLRIRERSAFMAREIVERDIETQMSAFLLDTNNYVLDTTLTATNEWDAANGDSRANIRASAKAIFDATGISYEKLSVFLTEQSLQAALEDPVFIAARSNFTADTADTAALQRYWGVGQVWVANPTTADASGTVSMMYGDIAIVYFDGDHSDFDTEFGRFTWAVQFRWNRGTALSPWFENQRTSWWFPWQSYGTWALINANCAAIIRNTAA